MIFPIRLSTVVQLGLVSTSVFGQELDKPAAWPNLDEFGPVLGRLSRPTTRISPWTNGLISSGCRDRVLYDGLDPTKFKSYDVYMGDCDMPWVFCREEGSEVSLEILVDTVARIPIHMRSYIGDVVHFKGGGGGSAWQASIVHVNGVSAGNLGLFLHEASHCIDGGYGLDMNSDEATWRDAYEADTHVADEYARTNHVENFAQYAGLIIYDRFTNGNLKWRPQYQQIKNQFTRMATAADAKHSWGENMFDFSVTKKCGRRWALRPAVDPVTGATMDKRDHLTSRSAGIRVVSPSSEIMSAPVVNCTISDEL